MNDEKTSDWMTVADAYAQLKQYFHTKGALQYHLTHRAKNGLLAADAVRMSPLGILLVNVARVRNWLLANPNKEAV